MAFQSKYFQEGKHKEAVGASGLTPVKPKAADTEYSWQRATASQTTHTQRSPVRELAAQMVAAEQSNARVQDAQTAAKRMQARQAYATRTAPTQQAVQAIPYAHSMDDLNSAAAAHKASAPAGTPVSGRLPGASGGAEPLTAASFGGVHGYRNITPARQEQPGGLTRVALGADAAASGLLGGIGSAVETTKAAIGAQADFVRDIGLKDYFTTPTNQLGEMWENPKYHPQMDMDSTAAKLMERAGEKTEAAVQGLGPKSEWVARNLISVGQNAPAMAASLIPVAGPAISGGIMAASAGGGRAYELQRQGLDAGQAFTRGAVSGAIELATEKFSIDNFLQLANGAGAKAAAKNLLRQMGVEASEESASYVLNYIADKAAKDPEAEFSLSELAGSAAGGAFSGGLFGGAGLALNRLGTNGQKNYQYLKERDSGSTPDFDQQHAHYYEAARSGLSEDRIPAYPTQTPMDETARRSAQFAGQNDGLAEATETVQKLKEGRAVSDTALDRALSFPQSRRAIEEQVGALPGVNSQDRAAVRSWANQQKQAAQSQATEQSQTAAQSLDRRTPGLADSEVSRRMRAEDREFHDTLLKAVGLRGEIVSQASDTANAQIENGTVRIYANADDAESAYRGTVKHEVTHQIKALGAENYQTFEDFAVEQMAARNEVSVASLVASMQEVYRQQAGQELTEAQAREEIAGDFATTLDIDAETIRRFTSQSEQNRQTAKGILQTIRDILRGIRERFTGRKLSRTQERFVQQLGEGERLWAEALGEASQRAKENAAQTDGGARFSIKRAADGSQYVEVDTDILEGVPRKNWVKTVKEYLKSNFPDGVRVGNNTVSINAQTRREMTYSEYTKWLRQNTADLYKDKLRATAFSDEILLASSDYISEGLRHNRKDDIRDFARGTVQLHIGATKYSADVIVGTRENGQMLLYDIVNMQKKADAPYSLDRGHAVDDGASADTSITDSDAEVNENLPVQFSLKGAGDAAARLARYREQYGALPRGEQAVRDIMFPKRTDEHTRVRRFSRTAAESASLTDEQADAIGAAVAEGRFNYEPVGDRAARHYAETMLSRGADEAAEAWNRVVARDSRASKNDIALGEYLLREAAKAGDTERVVQLTAEIAAEGTRAGQVVQAMRLLKQLDGAGQLVSLDAMLKKLQGDLDKGKSGVFLKISDELRQELAGAKGENEVNAVLDKIYDELARQMPSTWADKWNAWRYLSMLGNPRTHIRNVLGNAAFEPAILVKNTIGTALERVFVPQGERTKSLSGLLPGTGGRARKFAQADFQEMKDIITGGGKMNPSDIIRERQQVFKTKALEWVRKQNFNFLEAEDGVFLEHHYVRAMTQYLKANRIDTATLNADSKEGAQVLNRAREYAVKEAQKATYRDFSLTAQVISQSSRNLGTAGRILVEGILPFKKTPINVLRRGVEYSPIGLADTVTRGTARLVSGKISASEFIDSLSAGLTGTGIAALGWLLASTGVLIGGGGDDKEQDFRDALGAQSWALRFGDKTYTIDWLAPSSMPLFVGAEAQRLYQNGMELNGRSVMDAALSIAEPLTQMSMLDGLNSMLTSVRFGDNPLSDLLTGAVTDYVNQAVPTLLGQVARTVDPVRRTTYDDKNSGVPSIMQKTAQKNANKIPFLSQQSAAYLDIWGREQFGGSTAERVLKNFISPGYLKNERLSDMENELIRLYQATGEGGALPGRAEKSFKVQEETVYLTADEYRLFAETRGTLMYSGLSEMTANSGYKTLPDVDKAKAVGNMIQLANAVAKTGVSDYELKGWYQKAVEGQKQCGIPLPVYALAYSAQSGLEGFRDKDDETISNSKGLRQMQAIYQIPGLNDKQRAYLFGACGVGKGIRHYNKAKVEQELKKMEKQAAR